jgi:thiol:disulfide interchange protein DsbD
MVVITTLAFLVSVFSSSNLSAQDIFSGFDDAFDEELADISAVFSVTSAEPGSSHAAAAVVTITSGWHINSSEPFDSLLIPAEMAFDTIDGLTPREVVYPAGINVTLAGLRMSVYHDRAVIFFDVAVDDTVAAGDYRVPVRLTYQACNDRECRAPQTTETLLKVTVGGAGEPAHVGLFDGRPPVVIAGETSSDSRGQQSDLQRLITDYGFWGYFLALGLAFVTGLLLSFSPCTYPMIPITVSIFAGQDRSIGKGFVMSLFYVGSMAIVYGIMGLIVSLVGGVFGAWLANPPVVIGIAVVFVIFALSMFGVYNLDVPSSIKQKLGTTRGGGGVIGVVVLGVIAALVVSPCVGPFVAGILLYVATYGSPVFGFLSLFVFAVGLGTLYIIIGTFSSTINSLPGAGGWMESVKKFFGFVLLLMALYFLRTIISPTLTAILTGLLLLAFGVFGGGLDRLTSESGFFARLKKLLGVLALLLGIYLVMGTVISQGFILPGASRWLSGAPGLSVEEEKDLIPWGTDLEQGLARASKEGKPVLIDTWATWCYNCRVLDKKTFRNPDVARESERFVPIKVQLEEAGSETTKAFMARFGLKLYSLPTTLLLTPGGEVHRIMQGVVGPDELIAEMKKIRK